LPENDFTDNDPDFKRRMPDFTSRYIPLYGKNGEVFYPRTRPGPDEPSPFADQYAQSNPENRGFRNLYHLFWIYGLYRDLRYSATVLRYPRPASYVGYFETDQARVSRVTDTLVAIKESASPRPVLVVFFPDYKSWSYVVTHPGSYEQSAVAGMRAVLERRGLRTMDLLEQWLGRGLDKEEIYLPCDGHWNEAGHQAAFEAVRPLVEDVFQSAAAPQPSPIVRPSAARPSR
jgi:hypothetical protein